MGRPQYDEPVGLTVSSGHGSTDDPPPIHPRHIVRAVDFCEEKSARRRGPALEQGYGFLKCVKGRKIYFWRNGLLDERLYGLSNLSQRMRLERRMLATLGRL